MCQRLKGKPPIAAGAVDDADGDAGVVRDNDGGDEGDDTTEDRYPRPAADALEQHEAGSEWNFLAGVSEDLEKLKLHVNKIDLSDWRDMVVLMRSTAGRIEMLLSACAKAGVPVYVAALTDKLIPEAARGKPDS